MSSRIIQFVWVQPQAKGVYRCSSHCTVAALTDDEWKVVESVSGWLTDKRREIQLSTEETKATGGDHETLAGTLAVLADYYNYAQMAEDNDVLLEHGIKRDAVATT
jgi:hypothetical protein